MRSESAVKDGCITAISMSMGQNSEKSSLQADIPAWDNEREYALFARVGELRLGSAAAQFTGLFCPAGGRSRQSAAGGLDQLFVQISSDSDGPRHSAWAGRALTSTA